MFKSSWFSELSWSWEHVVTTSREAWRCITMATSAFCRWSVLVGTIHMIFLPEWCHHPSKAVARSSLKRCSSLQASAMPIDCCCRVRNKPRQRVVILRQCATQTSFQLIPEVRNLDFTSFTAPSAKPRPGDSPFDVCCWMPICHRRQDRQVSHGWPWLHPHLISLCIACINRPSTLDWGLRCLFHCCPCFEASRSKSTHLVSFVHTRLASSCWRRDGSPSSSSASTTSPAFSVDGIHSYP